MIELISPRKVAQSPYRKRLAEAGVKGGWNYALDHAWLYEKIDGYIKERPEARPIVLDVGCGNGMLHTFLEEELHLGIIGIDRIFGKCPFNERDRRMDICIDFAKENTIFKNNADIIYWCSSIEHNTVPEIKECVRVSMEALKPGGMFLATFAHSPVTAYYPPSEQTNLSQEDAEAVFDEKWVGDVDFEAMLPEYQENHFDLLERHKKRYGSDRFNFVVAAVQKIKK